MNRCCYQPRRCPPIGTAVIAGRERSTTFPKVPTRIGRVVEVSTAFSGVANSQAAVLVQTGADRHWFGVDEVWPAAQSAPPF